ncbi:MAG TPA: alpha/beta hydrolase [Acidimicrobiales bacterium]
MAEGYDEFAFLADNAADAGLARPGRPAVRRTTVALPDGRSLSALVWGQTPPEVVVVHGGAQNAHTWDTVALALDRPLVALDLPGHGHSDWRADHDYRPATIADDLAVAVEELAPHADLVVGMSLGGLSALVLAVRHPSLVRRLMLVDITPGVDATKTRAITEFVSGPQRFASFDEILERTIAHNPTRSRSSLRRGVAHNAVRGADGTWTWRWDPTRTMGRSLDGGVDFARLWDDLSALAVPLTLLRGAESPVVDDADVVELRRRRPDVEVVVVDGAGHSIQGDRPVETAALIAERLRTP